MMTLNNYRLAFFLSAFCISCFSTHAFSGETIYQLKDSNGTTLLTNKKSKYNNLKVEKKTYYPDSNIHSYANWGQSEASVPQSQNKSRNAFDSYINQAAQTHGISPGLIKAVMHTESGFNINARSPVGAQGLMQLMPATARRFNVSDAYDPQQNIFAGAKYLAWLLKRFNGHTHLALAGYNAGEGNVAKYGGIPPFKETQDYVRRVTSRLNNLYSNGLGSISGGAQASYSAQNIQNSSELANPVISQTHSLSNYSNRPIILTADGTYTDTPSGSYATQNASATAKIYISN